MTIFGEQLRNLRIKRGVSIRFLSKSTGIHRSSIYNWEHGKAIPKSHELISLISNFFNVPATYFFQTPSKDIPMDDISTEIQKLHEEIKSLRKLYEKLESYRNRTN